METTDHILNGDGSKAGLKQMIDERRQADLGASGLGRVSVKLRRDLDLGHRGRRRVRPQAGRRVQQHRGATVTGPTGSPPVLDSISGRPIQIAGETVTFSFTLPDGTTATSRCGPPRRRRRAAGEFTIGADLDRTATNLQTALTAASARWPRPS